MEGRRRCWLFSTDGAVCVWGSSKSLPRLQRQSAGAEESGYLRAGVWADQGAYRAFIFLFHFFLSLPNIECGDVRLILPPLYLLLSPRRLLELCSTQRL